MSLDALAPDQRAVVQLILQQDRSYDDLASMLGTTPTAVRERAHRGLGRLVPTNGVDPDDRAEISDYLLGQQSEPGGESTRELLQVSAPGRAWALAVTDQLAEVARSPLPEVPDASEAVLDEPTPAAADPEPAAAATPSRARPRPRDKSAPVADFGFDETEDETDADAGAGAGRRRSAAAGGADRTSRLGGALLLAGLAIGVVALVVFLATRGGGDDTSESASASPTPTATATATASPAGTTPAADYQPIGYLALRPSDGGSSRGRFIVYASQQQRRIAFNVLASGIAPTPEGTAYGVWLTGGDEDHFLGFAPAVGENGRLRVSGPRPSDQQGFATWFTEAKEIVVTTETSEGPSAPGPIVLTGTVEALKSAAKGAGAGATPAPTP